MEKQFYRQGEKIFEAGTNRYIDMPEWQSDWTGRATEIAAPGGGGPDPKAIEQQENIMGREVNILVDNMLGKL